MRTGQRTLIPVTVRPSPQGMNVQLVIFLSFAAGLLLGVPLTICAMFLGSLHQEDVQQAARKAIPPPGDWQTIREASSTRPGHPVETWLTNVRKSGLGASGARVPFEGSNLLGENLNLLAPLSDTQVMAENFGENKNILPLNSTDLTEALVDGVFWSDFSEKLVPQGFGNEEVRRWRHFLNTTEVLKVEEGCGRMQNRLVTLAEGGRSCCRYRHNNDQIQGEIFSFYLGRLLGVDNLAPSALALLDPGSKRWSEAASQMALALWSSDRPAVLTRYVDGLHSAYIPRHFRNSKKRRLHPIREDLTGLVAEDVRELVQWSDLIIFDYLTANLDRVVNNMYNERWNPGMMSQPTHNLAKTSAGLLLFLDNESGLLHGYRLLDKYEHFHRSLLDSLCVFRRRTVLALRRLLADNNVEVLLKRSFHEGDPGMSDWLPFLPDRTIRTLKDRMAQVLRQVKTCRSRFESIVTDR